ncbi:hypothetical protein ABZ372_44335, partial [Streptomyces sp. NPDC005921]
HSMRWSSKRKASASSSTPSAYAPTSRCLSRDLMTVDSAVQHYRGRGAAWKGRTYARPGTVADEG